MEQENVLPGCSIITRTRDDLYLIKGTKSCVFLERFFPPANVDKMPSKMIVCEYCTQGFRKDRLALHVKSKHIKELAKQFLDDATKPLFNPIQSVVKGHDPKNIPIYSKADYQACYYFGIVPKYFEEQDSFSSYIHNDDNMKEHKRFLDQIISTISVQDYYKATGKVLLNKLTPMEELQCAVDSMKETIKQKDAEIEILHHKLDAIREAFKKEGRWTSVRFDNSQYLSFEDQVRLAIRDLQNPDV